MEALTLFACFLSLPLIYYGSKPPTPQHRTITPAVPTEVLRQQAVDRRAMVFSHLSEEEKTLVTDYLNEIKNPSKHPPNQFFKAVDFIVVTLLLGFIALVAYWAYTDQLPGFKGLKPEL